MKIRRELSTSCLEQDHDNSSIIMNKYISRDKKKVNKSKITLPSLVCCQAEMNKTMRDQIVEASKKRDQNLKNSLRITLLRNI